MPKQNFSVNIYVYQTKYAGSKKVWGNFTFTTSSSAQVSFELQSNLIHTIALCICLFPCFCFFVCTSFLLWYVTLRETTLIHPFTNFRSVIFSCEATQCPHLCVCVSVCSQFCKVWYLALDNYIRLYMNMYDFVWLCMTMYDYVWLCMTMYGYVWLCMTIYDSVLKEWLCMTMYNKVWLLMTNFLYMKLYDSEWLCMIIHNQKLYFFIVVVFNKILKQFIRFSKRLN